jgi:hypothetical protein
MLITLSTTFGLTNPLNAMQILLSLWKVHHIHAGDPTAVALIVLGLIVFILVRSSEPVPWCWPAMMRKPPQKKDKQIINRHICMRVIFSAEIIVASTLFIYQTTMHIPYHSSLAATSTSTGAVRGPRLTSSWVAPWMEVRGWQGGLEMRCALRPSCSTHFMHMAQRTENGRQHNVTNHKY